MSQARALDAAWQSRLARASMVQGAARSFKTFGANDETRGGQEPKTARENLTFRSCGRSAARWWIEEYHKALKSGTGVEDSQLERGDRLEPLIAVLAVVAVRLLSTKMLARSRPESFEAASSFGPEMLALLEKKLGLPKDGWNNRNVLIATARLGGFLARQHDGLPGWQTIWRGWQRLMWMCEGIETLMAR